MIRVLNICPLASRGGTEAIVFGYYQNLKHDEFEFDFLAINIDKIPDELQILSSSNIYKLKILGGKKNYIKDTKTLNSFFKKHKNDFDVVIQHIQHPYDMKAIKTAYRFGLSCFIYCHSMQKSYKDTFLSKLITKKNYAFVKEKKIIALGCSDDSIKFCAGNSCKNSFVIPSFIKTDSFKFNERHKNKLMNLLATESKCKIYGHIGRYSIVKNQTRIIDIFNLIHNQDDCTKLFLVGVGEETYSQIIKHIDCLNLNNCVICIKDTDIPNYMFYSFFDYFIFPSLYEGFPVSIVEAQTSGLPCFISNKVIPREVKCTDLVKFISLDKSNEEWAKIILSTPINKHREKYAEIVKSKGFDVKDATDKFCKIIKDVVNEK